MSPRTILGAFLLALLTVQTVSNEASPDRDCCFTDACTKKSLCGAPNEIVTDDCGTTFRITEACGLTRPCCFTDACSKKSVCQEDDGVLRDSCGSAFDVDVNCTLSRRENDDGGNGTMGGVTDTQDAGPESTMGESFLASPEPTPFSEVGDPIEPQITITPTPEVPLTTPLTQPSPTSIPSIADPTTEEDIATSISSEAVCIHTQHLSHLPSSALLFPQHVLANVLCDSFASCATPGHMVVYKGETMRMSGYCKIVGCQRERGLVNNPRYSRGGRVESSTKDLVFTMLAARFETRFEEIVLAGLVRVGL